jgi:hypothetical protein
MNFMAYPKTHKNCEDESPDPSDRVVTYTDGSGQAVSKLIFGAGFQPFFLLLPQSWGEAPGGSCRKQQSAEGPHHLVLRQLVESGPHRDKVLGIALESVRLAEPPSQIIVC